MVGYHTKNKAAENIRTEKTGKMIALAGNPNVGKSTVFNALTGMKQHTGNWAGKTVANAFGRCTVNGTEYTLADIPGTYSLFAHSKEEEVARSFVCFGGTDAVVVVCDAACLERNLNLALQIMETSSRVILCINMMDEAQHRGIEIDIKALSDRLKIPVVGITAHKKRTLCALTDAMDKALSESPTEQYRIKYIDSVEKAIMTVQRQVQSAIGNRLDARWVSLRLLDGDEGLLGELNAFLGQKITEDESIKNAVEQARLLLAEEGIDEQRLKEIIVSCTVLCAEDICLDTVKAANRQYDTRDRKTDSLLTGRGFGYAAMLLLLALILWITIFGANYPSRLLSELFEALGSLLRKLMQNINSPKWLESMIVDGIYGVPAQVISVMLPPMAIFFPLFTLLEDSGYLPRVAYNLDLPFKKCSACGKQALTMCMGFGCNAVGVTGCRIIDSPRERIIALLTNSLVPCNGRFPMLIAIITAFFVGTDVGLIPSVTSALVLTLFILLSIGMTFLLSKLLSATLLRGKPSSFTLELPPYRRPQIGRVIVRSVLDRTLFVLGRAVCVALPAGLIIWLAANVSAGEVSLLRLCANALDPFAKIMGLDGVILMSFILGFPANETVIPIAVMAYMSCGGLTDLSTEALHELFVTNGWTMTTAVCFMLFTLFHFPCSTTMLTVYKETKSVKWTALSFLLPLATGIIVCIAVAGAARILGIG